MKDLCIVRDALRKLTESRLMRPSFRFFDQYKC